MDTRRQTMTNLNKRYSTHGNKKYYLQTQTKEKTLETIIQMFTIHMLHLFQFNNTVNIVIDT